MSREAQKEGRKEGLEKTCLLASKREEAQSQQPTIYSQPLLINIVTTIILTPEQGALTSGAVVRTKGAGGTEAGPNRGCAAAGCRRSRCCCRRRRCCRR